MNIVIAATLINRKSGNNELLPEGILWEKIWEYSNMNIDIHDDIRSWSFTLIILQNIYVHLYYFITYYKMFNNYATYYTKSIKNPSAPDIPYTNNTASPAPAPHQHQHQHQHPHQQCP
jgi:hypothetical protein